MGDWNKIERVANLMADAAGKAIMPHFRANPKVDNKEAAGYDPVTLADRAAEQAMRELIEEHFPADGIFGEEFGEKVGTSGNSWILDPIDGTRGFIAGLPLWGTLIALHDGTATCFGLMDQPFLRERYGARKGESAYVEVAGPLGLQNTRNTLATRECSVLSDAFMMCTSLEIFTAEELPFFRAVEQQVAMSRYGGDCYAYCMLAAGHIDLVVEAGLHAYDIQALIPIIECAGGVITDWQGQPIAAGGNALAAGDRRVHAEALKLLQSSA